MSWSMNPVLAAANRRAALLACVAGLMLPPAPPARPSEEAALRWSTFALSSMGVDASGPVTVSGTQDDHGVTSLSIKAFERDLRLKEDELQKLTTTGVNGMQLSYEEGTRPSGGRTIYVKLSTGFISGETGSVVVSVNERGDVVVGKPTHK